MSGCSVGAGVLFRNWPFEECEGSSSTGPLPSMQSLQSSRGNHWVSSG